MSGGGTMRWVKDCNCAADATTNAYRLDEVTADVTTFVGRIVLGPSCNRCGRPWRIESATEHKEADHA